MLHKQQKKKTTTIEQWLKHHLSTLEKQKKRSMIFFALWANILALINIATLSVATYAIYILLYNRDKYGDNKVILYLTISSVAVIVISFILTFVVTIYKGVMKSKYYKSAMDKIHLEVIKRNHNQGEYEKGLAKDKDAKLLENVKKHYWSAIDQKMPQTKKFIILKAILGGNNV